MTFLSNQRPAAPWKNSNWWGLWDTAANLPNVAGSPAQMSDVQKGDTAWADAPAGLYLCTSATPGAAVWTLVAGGGGGSNIVGPMNVAYVEQPVPDGRGDDATGARGDASLPFATIKAALAACVAGEENVIRIAAGTFTIGVVGDLPVWPAGVDRLIVEGSGTGFSLASGGGVGDTAIVSSVAGSVFNPPNTADYIEFRHLRVSCSDPAGIPFTFNGAGGARTFLGGNGEGALVMRDVVAQTGGTVFAMTDVGISFFYDCFLFGSGASITSSNILTAEGSSFSDLEITWDETDASRPNIGRTGITFLGCTVDDVLLVGQPKIEASFTKFSRFEGDGLSESGALMPEFVCFNCFFQEVNFFDAGKELPTLTAPTRIEFIGSTMLDGFKFRQFADVAQPTQEIVAFGISVRTGAGAIQAGHRCQIAIGHGDVPRDTASYATPDATGTIEPDQIHLTVVHAGVGPQVAPFTFRAPTPPRDVQATGKQVASGFYAVTATTAADVTIDSSLAVGGDVDVLASWT